MKQYIFARLLENVTATLKRIEAFLYLDSNGFIQNEIGIPIFFHIYRRANIKAIYSKELTINNRRFDTSVYSGDKNMIQNINIKKYWWLSD